MKRSDALSTLKAREQELRRMGINGLSLFGSTARDEAGDASDVDIAAEFDPHGRIGMFEFAQIAGQLREMLGKPVDLVGEPARKVAIQAEIDRDRVRVF